MAVDGWALVDTQLVTLTPGEEEVAEWRSVVTLTVTLTPGEEEVAEWRSVATLTVTLTPGEEEVAGWKLVNTQEVTLKVPTAACKTNADCPEGYVCVDGICVEKGGLSPLVLAGIAAGAIGVIAIAKKKPTQNREKR